MGLSLPDETELSGVEDLALIGKCVVASKAAEVGVEVVVDTGTRLDPIPSRIVAANGECRSCQHPGIGEPGGEFRVPIVHFKFVRPCRVAVERHQTASDLEWLRIEPHSE